MINNLKPVLFVITGIVTTALAQIILKIGSSFEVFKIKWLFYLCLSLFCYSIAFIAYYLALRYFDVSKISPIMMASTVIIIAFYGFLVGENITVVRLVGILLAIISIIFISQS